MSALLRQQKHLVMAGLALALAVAGCQKEEIQSYRAQKDLPPPAAPTRPMANSGSMPAGHPHVDTPSRPKPKVTWTLPAGWEDVGESRMSVATFKITCKGDHEAQVAITPMGRSLEGKEAIIVNMWRTQAGQSELSEAEA